LNKYVPKIIVDFREFDVLRRKVIFPVSLLYLFSFVFYVIYSSANVQIKYKMGKDFGKGKDLI
jgi:hypothetical protein